MNAAAPLGDRIGRLRIRVSQGEAFAGAPALQSLELHPAGLDPEAIVVARRLQMSRRAQMPGSAWRAGAQAAVAAALRSAARPAEGPVPASCQVVLFADMAELLACLARDGFEGSLALRWWWHALFPNVPVAELLARAWRQHAEHQPAAVAVLHARGWPVPFFDEGGGARFALPAPAHEQGAPGATFAPPGSTGAPPASPGAGTANGDPRSGALTAQDVSGFGPSADGAPASNRIPSQPRAAGADATAAAAAAEVPMPQARPVLLERQGRPVEVAAPSPIDPPAATTPRGAKDTRAPAATEPESQPPVRGRLPRRDAELRADAPAADRDPAWRWTGDAPLSNAAGPVPAAHVARWSSGAARPESTAARTHTVPDTAFDTGFGGLFYLLNVALHLGLYGDFTQPRAAVLALSPWDLLAWLGRRWFGIELVIDPLWAALAHWSGRDPLQDPAAALQAPDEWRLAPAWLQAFEPLAVLSRRRVGRRLLLNHPAGFCVQDLAAPGPALPDGAVACVDRPPRAAHGFDVPDRWLAHLARYVRARCALALQMPRGQVPARVVRHRARVRRAADGVTVQLSLAELPLAVRMAGLDRDPGWIPAAGCGLRFVFD